MTRILLAVLILATGAALPALPADVSRDLSLWLADGEDSDRRADVIVQLDGRGALDEIAELLEGARNVRTFERLEMIAADLPEDAVRRLSAHPSVAAIGLDAEVRAHGEPGRLRSATGADSVSGALRLTGREVGIAFLDTGVGPEVLVEPVKSVSVVPGLSASDGNGHGSVMAAAAVGESRSRGRVGERAGIAPSARAISIRVLDAEGRGRTSWVLAGIEWLLGQHERLGVKVVNMSLGGPGGESYRVDPLCRAAHALHDAGLIVVVSAGNDGTAPAGRAAFGSIASPGHAPWVITVGAVDDAGTVRRSDDKVARYSSRGPTRGRGETDRPFDHMIKPDLVAPGGWTDGGLEGTSLSAAVVSGVVALMLEADPSLTPSMVRAALMYSAQPIFGFSVFEQGSGQVNADGAARLAHLLARRSEESSILVALNRMPLPYSTIAGEIVPWSAGNVVMRRAVMKTTYEIEDGRLSFTRRIEDELVPSGGWLFVRDVLFGPGIVSTAGLLFADGVRFEGSILYAASEHAETQAGRAAALAHPPSVTPDALIDLSHVRYFDAAILGQGNLVDGSGEVLASDALIAGGLVFTDAPAVGLGIRVRSARRLAASGHFENGEMVPVARRAAAVGVSERDTSVSSEGKGP
ncbi:MAG: S8 family serine peptidase [Acidobacteriota bacterium]|nr:S8 family serine peptidase [Acidobacteriota bacterium]